MSKWLKNWWFSIAMFLFAIGLTVYIIISSVVEDYDYFILTLLLISAFTPILIFLLLGLASIPRKEKKDEIIEKELKEYEKMKSIKGTTTLDSALEETLIKACPNVANKLKALEIIRNKKIDVGFLNRELKGYNAGLPNKYKLTKKEYDLLKEVLS